MTRAAWLLMHGQPLASLKQNPFAVLGASTTDDMHRLLQLTEDAQLFGDDDAEAAFAALTHTMHRLDAEMRWLPGAPAGEHGVGRHHRLCRLGGA